VLGLRHQHLLQRGGILDAARFEEARRNREGPFRDVLGGVDGKVSVLEFHHQGNVEPLDTEYGPIDRCLVEAGADYKRYAVTESGVSPRAIPGGDAFVVMDSDEHTDAGKISEDLIGHMTQQDKRMRKLDGMRSEALPPEWYGPKNAERLMICWGSTYGACREAVDANNADDRRKTAAMLHFAQVYPIDADAVRKTIGKRDEVYCVEGNQTGQFADLLREQGALGDAKLLTRYDGMPFTCGYILEAL